MAKKAFVSYSWSQKKWVREYLCPCLEAGGAQVLIDRQFEPGKRVKGQMDAKQDEADLQLLVLSPEYLQSPNCRHEMKRAIQKDPGFEDGLVIPIQRVKCKLPAEIRKPNPLYLDMSNDEDAEPWHKLLQACRADLGTSAPHWLEVRDEMRTLLDRSQSVSLVVTGEGIAWKKMLEHLVNDCFQDILTIDLWRGATASRRGLVTAILRGMGFTGPVPDDPEDLVLLDSVFEEIDRRVRIILTHFDLVVPRYPVYKVDFFTALASLIMDSRKLVLLAQSRSPFAALLPRDHPLSSINIQTVELRGQS